MQGETYNINREIIIAPRNNAKTFWANFLKGGTTGSFYHSITRPVPEQVQTSALVFPSATGSIDFSADGLAIEGSWLKPSQGSVYFSNSNEAGGIISFADYTIGPDSVPILVKFIARYNGISEKEPETPKPPRLEYSFNASSSAHLARIINPDGTPQPLVNADWIFQNPGQIVTISDSNPGSNLVYTLEVGSYNGIDCLIQSTLELEAGTEGYDWQAAQEPFGEATLDNNQARPVITRVIPLSLPTSQVFNPDPAKISLANADMHESLSSLSSEELRNAYEGYLANLIHPVFFIYD